VTARVELIGGRFDGLVADVPADCVRLGFLIVPECPRHGPLSYCDCPDELWYGYYAATGKGAGRFVVREGA